MNRSVWPLLISFFSSSSHNKVPSLQGQRDGRSRFTLGSVKSVYNRSTR